MLRIARIEGHSFVANPLRPGSVVLDFGMNEGRFARSVRDRFGCRVIGLEPSPALFRAVAGTPGVVVEPEALSARDGAEAVLYVNELESASIVEDFADDGTSAVRVRGVSLASFLRRHAVPAADLAKFDIEGAELEVLETAEDETLLRLRQLTVEFHDFVDRRLHARVERIHERMAGLGFTAIRFTASNYDVLYLHPDLRPGPVDRCSIAAQKYGRAARRRLQAAVDPGFDKDRL